jgi:hypothetical protein
MLHIVGRVGETELTGRLYEVHERPPTFGGAPDEGAPYTWVCDGFYEVESGGARQRIGDREINIAFEEPLSRGFEAKDAALAAAKEHLRTQFARVGVPAEDVDIEVLEAEEV